MHGSQLQTAAIIMWPAQCPRINNRAPTRENKVLAPYVPLVGESRPVESVPALMPYRGGNAVRSAAVLQTMWSHVGALAVLRSYCLLVQGSRHGTACDIIIPPLQRLHLEFPPGQPST